EPRLPPDAEPRSTTPQVASRSGFETSVLPARNASTTTWVSVALPRARPSTRIVIACSPGPSPSKVRATPNAGRAAYWSNVPFATPSIETEALPRLGPTAVNQVTDPPANANEAVAPAR